MWSKDDSNIRNVSVRATRDDWDFRSVRLAIFAELWEPYTGATVYNKPRRVVFHNGEFVEPGEQELYPVYGDHIYAENAQVLMDDLWRCGIRPTEGAGSAGAMNAVQEHLKLLTVENEWLKAKIDQLLEEKNDGTR
jgi:hypothetical protein